MNAVFRFLAIILAISATGSFASAESSLPAPARIDVWPTVEIAADDFPNPIPVAANLTDPPIATSSAAPSPSGVKTLKVTVWQNAPGGSSSGSDAIPYPNVKGVLFLDGQAAGTITTNADGVAYLQNIEEGLAELVAESEADSRFGSEEFPVQYEGGALASLDFLLTDHGLVRFDAKNPVDPNMAQKVEVFDEFQPDSISQPLEYYPENGQYPNAGHQRYGRAFQRRHWGLLGLAGLAGLAGIEPVSPSSPSK